MGDVDSAMGVGEGGCMTKEESQEILEWSQNVSKAWKELMKLYACAQLYRLAEKCQEQSRKAEKFASIMEAEIAGNEYFGIKNPSETLKDIEQ